MIVDKIVDNSELAKLAFIRHFDGHIISIM